MRRASRILVACLILFSNLVLSGQPMLAQGPQQISLSSTCGAAGSSITVSGTGWYQSNTAVNIVYDPGGKPPSSVTATPDLDGYLTAVLPVPTRRAGIYKVVATQPVTGETYSVNFREPCPPPPIIRVIEASTQRSCGPAQTVAGTVLQYRITVSGSGIDPSFPTVYVVFDSGGQQPQTFPGPFNVVKGSFTAALQPGPGYRTFGTYTVTVFPYGNFIAAPPSWSAYFQVPCSSIALSATCAAIGDPITITGAGFQPNLETQFVFRPGGATLPSVFPDAGGSFQTTITVPNFAPGTYQLSALQPNRLPQNTRAAGASLKVPCFNAVITLSPALGPPGTVVVLTGTGFPVGAVVKLSWSQGIPGSLPTINIGASQGFQLVLLIFPHDWLGGRAMSASPDLSVTNAPLFNIATASFLVVAGTEQPRDFSWRH